MTDFVEVLNLDQIPPGAGFTFNAAGKSVAVFNVNGTIYAIDDTCPHQGCSLGVGKLDGNIVTCRSHGTKFDVTTGCFAGTTAPGVTCYRVAIVDEKIMVALGTA